MKTSNQWFSPGIVAMLLSASMLCAQDSNVAGSGTATAAKPAAESNRASANSPRLSRGISDLLKMQEKGIDKNVIRSYIENSAIAYQPSVEEIIYLHQQGVPDDLTTLMIQHGAQLRAQAPAPSQPMPAPSATGADSVPVTAPAPMAQPIVVSAPAPVYTPSTTYVYSEPYPIYGPSVSVDLGFWGAPYWRSYPYYRYGGFYGGRYVGHGWGGGYHGGGYHGGGFGGSHSYGGGGHVGGGHGGGGGGGHHR